MAEPTRHRIRGIPDLEHRTVTANGIELHVAQRGSGRPVVLLHGFPETWRCWRHQIDALAGAGYRVIVPDQRGYGASDRPSAVEDYDITHLAGDLSGLLDAVGEPSAVFVGHDWGAAVAWLLARLAPERVEAVAGMSVPATPRPSRPPVRSLAEAMGAHFHYIVYFQEVGPADRELDADPHRSLRAWYSPEGGRRFLAPRPREGTGVLDVLGDPEETPEWLDLDDLEAAASDFARTGFTGGLNWYRNLDRNWELTEGIAGETIAQPALFVAGERDAVLAMWPPSLMDGLVEDLHGSVVLPGAGHWIQQERPAEVNEALLGFLSDLPAR